MYADRFGLSGPNDDPDKVQHVVESLSEKMMELTGRHLHVILLRALSLSLSLSVSVSVSAS